MGSVALSLAAAVLVLGERPGRRGVAGLLLVGAGVLLLFVLDVERAGVAGAPGMGAILLAGACIAWAGDNTLARGASALDPFLVVSIKGLSAGIALTLASAGSPWPLHARGWGLVVLAGGVGVGVSLVLELLALGRIGAALNAGLFATGPAFGFNVEPGVPRRAQHRLELARPGSVRRRRRGSLGRSPRALSRP